MANTITFALNSCALPAGEVGVPYSYYLRQKLSVTGDATFSGSTVKFVLATGQTLPGGLNLASGGVISDTPTTTNTTGTLLQGGATYKVVDGKQV